MKLKSLEIEGFKSFPNKTLLVFNQSVTGIVGPNGCGKSNVVDAIRWVMGEQSAKHLRGKSMEDVIFSGARDRGPSSLASVELTFTTDGAQTPPQYENCQEISVARKLFRSGESEYFINKQVARLKDVKDLFLGTGIGAHAYSIIEQGSIGQMVTAKPEDRRRIVEEAAGISKFQIRKEAAERKMEATAQNLLRLKDILTELERQKSALERQAKKAEKFKIIHDELQTLDLNLTSWDYDKLNTRQDGTLQAIRELDAHHFESTNALADSENRFEASRLSLTEVERVVADLQQSVYECDNILTIAESRLQNKKTEAEHLTREIQDEINRHQNVEQNLDETCTALESANALALNADLDFASYEENLALLDTAHAQTQALASELFSTIETVRNTHHEATKRIIEMTSRRSAAELRLEELEQKKCADTEELTDITAKHRRLVRLFADVQEGLADVKQLKLTLTERTTETATQLGVVEMSLESEQRDLEHIKEELLSKKSRLNSLEELERNFEGYQDGPKALLEKRRAGELGNVLGAVTDFIETEPRYEGAVSAVLGERTQCLVVQTAMEGVTCAEILKNLNTGRGSFVALGLPETHGVGIRAITGDGVAGFCGYLSDYVNAKPGYEALKSVLIGDTILVETLGHAFEAWQTVRRPVVTFDGEVISEGGVLSGGNLEKTSKALFEKKREIKSLSAETSELVDLVKAKEEQCFDLTRKIKMLKADLDQIKSSAHAEELKITSQEKDVTHCQSEIASLDDRRQRLSAQLLSVETSIQELGEELTSLCEDEARERETLIKAETVLAAKKSEENFYQHRLSQEREVLTQEKICFAQAREQKSYYEKEVERLHGVLLRLDRDEVASRERQGLLEKQRLFIADRISFAEKNITRILTSKREVDATYNEQKSCFEELNNALLEHEFTLKTLRRENSELKDELNHQTLTLTELRGRLTRLKEQVFERYQLALEEVFALHLIPITESDYADKTARADELRGQMARAGNVNLGAIDELKEVSERFDFLNKQRIDLESSLSSLEQAIQKINQTTKTRFVDAFNLINEKFAQLFPKLFEGGEAHLLLTDPDNILTTGVDIIAQPPGKKLQSITLLSGGEKALTAVSLLFAIFLIKPSPFCLLDEVDAPLDDANVDRYNDIVKEMCARTQFIVITHNKRTMQVTDALYGVTMEKSGISQLVSVNLD